MPTTMKVMSILLSFDCVYAWIKCYIAVESTTSAPPPILHCHLGHPVADPHCNRHMGLLRLRVGHSREDFTFRQRFAQLVGSFISHLRVGDFEPRQLFQTEDVLDPSVTDWSASQV